MSSRHNINQLISTNTASANNIDIENAIIGSCILERDAINRVYGMIDPEMFYSNEHREVFSAIKSMYATGHHIDMLTVAHYLRSSKVFKVNAAHFLAVCSTGVITTAHLETHAVILRELFLEREIERIKHSGGDGDVVEQAYKIQEMLKKALEMNFDDDWMDMTQMMIALQKHRDTVKGREILGVPTGFYQLDRILGGLQPTWMIIVAARPAVGKSALIAAIAVNAAKLKHKVGIISLEMPAEQSAARFTSFYSDVEYWRIYRSNHITPEQDQYVVSEMGKMSSLPIFTSSKTNVTAMAIRAKAEKLKNTKGLDLLIIDYLQLVESEGKASDSREREVAKMSRSMKLMAMELNIPVIVLCQLNRDSEKPGAPKKPRMSQMRESGCLTGDTIIFQNGRSYTLSELNNTSGFNVLAHDKINNSFMNAKKCFYSGEKEVFELELSTGHSIKATGNHKFLTPEGWKPLNELANSKVAIPIQFPEEDNSVTIEIAQLVGDFLSNGCALKGTALHYTCNSIDQDLADIVMSNAVAATGGMISPRKLDTVTKKSKFTTVFFKSSRPLTHNVSNPITVILKKYGLWDVRTKQKFIPDELYHMSVEKTSALLRSLFSGDGTVYFKKVGNRTNLKITYSSASKLLIYGIQQLLQKIGIVSFIVPLSNKKGQSWFCLYISGRSNIDIFKERVGFHQKRKQQILINGWQAYNTTKRGWTTYDFNYNRTLCFAPVKSITPLGVQKVYDIEVPVHHNFTANGFIVHNSLEQDADVVIILHRDFKSGITTNEQTGESTENEADLIIEKHRNGETASLKIGFNPETMKFHDEDPILKQQGYDNPNAGITRNNFEQSPF